MSIWDGYKPGAAASPPSAPTGSIWSGYNVKSAPAPVTPANPLEQHVVNSFQAIDPERRQVVLTNLVKQAKAGDQAAAHKVALLAPHYNAPAPATPDYKPKDFGSKLGSALYDFGSGVVTSAKNTGEDIITAPHIINAGVLALASMGKGDKGAQLAHNKQVVLDEANKSSFARAVGIADPKKQSTPEVLAKIGGRTLENVLNVATLGEGTIPEQAGKQLLEQGGKAIASKASIGLANKLAMKSQSGFIRNLASGQFDRTAVHPDDAAVMAAFIDHARGISKLDPQAVHNLELDASRIAEHYNIGGKAATNAKLANAFDKVLTASPEALRGGAKEAGHIGLPGGLQPEGRLFKGTAGERLASGAKLGAGYGVAQAGEQTITDPLEIAKTVGTSALTGGALAVAGPAVGKAISGTAGRIDRLVHDPIGYAAEERVSAAQPHLSQQEFDQAVKTEIGRIKSNPEAVKAINEAYGQGGLKGLNPDTGVPAPAPLKVPVEGQGTTQRGTGTELSARTAPEAPTKPTTPQQAAIAASDAGKNLSSRAHQFDASLQDTIKTLEGDKRYQAALKSSGGDKVISNEAVHQAASEAGPLDHKTIINAKPLDKIDTVTLVRAKATVDQAGKEFVDNWKKMESKGLSEAEITKQADHLAKLEAGYKVMSAEPGRATQIQASFIDDAFKRAQKLKELIQNTKGVTPELRNKRIAQDLADFDKQMARASKSGDYSPSMIEKLKTAIVQHVTTGAEATSEYATAAKLTSPLTHAKNLAGNISTLLTRSAEKAITIGWGAAKGETSLGEAKYIFGSSEAYRTAFTQLAKDLKQTFSPHLPDIEQATSKAESGIKPAISGEALGVKGNAAKGVDVAGKIIRTPFNLLSAGDNFFKTLLHDSEIKSQAFSKAYQEGFRGGALDARVKEIAADPTPDMLARAKAKGEEFTLQDDPGIVANKLIEIMTKLPLIRLLVPFIKTPTNAVKFQYQRSALGVFSKRNISDIMSGGIERREAVARLTVGTGLSLGAVMAVMNLGENITGAAPTASGEKDNFYAANKKPYSILINGTWYQYNAIQPLGQYLTQAVALRDALTGNKSKTAGNIISSMAVTIAKGFTDLPFVSGVSNVIAALNDPSNQSLANKALGGIVTGLIPNASRDVANAQDPTARQSKTITDQVKAMIPNLGINPNFNKQTLPARKTVFGTEQTSSNSPFERGVLKIATNDQSTDLTRALDDIGQQTGYYPQPPKAGVKVNGKDLTPAQFDKYQERSGALFATKLEKALSDAAFSQLPVEDKKRTLETMVTDARSNAADEIVGKAAKNPKHKIKKY